jgi:hypothetical protein
MILLNNYLFFVNYEIYMRLKVIIEFNYSEKKVSLLKSIKWYKKFNIL